MNILISGGAGFIGSNLSLSLIERGHSVTILDNLSKQIHGECPSQSPLFKSVNGKVSFVHGSVTSKDDWRRALNGQDMVVHFAAETGTGQSMYEIEKYCSVNVGGTAVLLDLITNDRRFTIKKLVVASSRSIYGEGKYRSSYGIVYPAERIDASMSQGDFAVKCPYTGEDAIPLPTDEESKIHPSSIYGITKQNQEQMVLTVGRALGIPSIAFRYQNVYGPGQSLTNPYTGILSIFSTLFRKNEDVNIFEDGTESRDFVFIDDVVKATILGIEHAQCDFKSYNVGSGVATSVLTVAEKLKSLYNSTSRINITGNYRLGDIRHNYADLSLIRKDLGFEPDFSFNQGIALFAEWVKTQQIQKNRYRESLEEMRAKGLYK